MNLFKRRGWERKMDREMRFHMESAIDDYIAQGIPREEAELRARREFGAVELAKDECRDQKPLEWVEQIFRDIRYALRSLARAPGFAAIAIVTLALGIGANTAVFSIVHGVLLRALPYPAGDRLVSIPERDSLGSVNIPEFAFLREHGNSFLAVALHRGGGERSIAAGDRRESGKARFISADFFQTLGVLPVEGREFTAQETRPIGPLSAILSKEFAARLFDGQDPIGRVVKVGETPVTIAGVLPAGFWFLDTADIYLPIRPVGDRRDEGFNYEMIARLKPGVSMRQALSEMNVVNESYARARPDLASKDRRLTVVSYREWLTGNVRTKLLLLLGAVGLLLLISCANLGGLLMARLAARQREIAVRRALGSSAGRLLRQFLIENLLIAGAGSATGLLGAYWILDGFVATIPFGLPASSPIRLDLPVLAFTICLALMVAIVFSIAPALRSARIDVYETLKSGGRMIGSAGRQTSRGVLVAMQVGLSAALLMGAALLIQSLYRLHHEDLGFDANDVITFWIPPAPERRGKIVALRQFENAVEDRLRHMPNVRAVGAVNTLPLTEQNNFPAQREGHPEHSIGGMEIRVVTPGYFEALRIRIVRGRALDARDTANSTPVVLVNEAVASRWWPKGDGLGDHVLFGRSQDKVYGNINDPPREVVGIVANTKSVYLEQPPRPTIYIPIAQAWFFEENLSWVVRAERGTTFPPDFAVQVRRAIAEIDPRQRVGRFQSMDEIVAATTRESRFDALLFGGFGGLALLLTAVGVYGLLSFAVVRRTAEIGTRVALGASRGAVVALVLRQGLVLVGAGVAVGLGAAALLTKFLTQLLFGVRPNDPLSFVAVAVLLLGAGALASYLPARRAANVDPMVALRCD